MPSRGYSAGLAGSAIFLAASLWTASPYPDGQDGVNFILGVIRFDLLFNQPHFPGYPVYMALGKISASIAGSPEWGLVLVSSLSMAGVVFLIYMTALARSGPGGAIAILALACLSPAVFQFSHKIYSEPLGLLLLAGAFYLLESREGEGRWSWIAAGAALGLLMGVRLSWWPFVPGFVYVAYARGKASLTLSGMAAGTMAWLAPLTMLTGAADLAGIGVFFVDGHFGAWGNTAISSQTDVADTFIAFAIGVGSSLGVSPGAIGLLGAPALLIYLAGVYVYAIKRNSLNNSAYGDGLQGMVVGVCIYISWILAGQNLDTARHFIPIVLTALLMAVPLAKSRGRQIALAALLLVPGNAGYLAAGAGPPPAIRLHSWLESQKGDDVTLYCGNAGRFFSRHSSRAVIRYADGPESLERLMDAEFPQAGRPLVCDDIEGVVFRSEPVVEFPARQGDLVDRKLRIYRPEPAPDGESD